VTRCCERLKRSLEVERASAWRLGSCFLSLPERPAGSPGPGSVVGEHLRGGDPCEQLSPLVEISKRLLGQLLSLRALDCSGANPCRIAPPGARAVSGRASIPTGVMGADFVAGQVIAQGTPPSGGLGFHRDPQPAHLCA